MKDTALHFLHIVTQKNPNNQFAKAIFNRLKNAEENVNLDEWQLLEIPFDTNITIEDFDNTKIEKNQDCRFFTLCLKGFRKFPFDKYYGVPFCPNGKDVICPPSTLIQGGNGSGKTSVFSAMEYLFTGQISAVEKQQLTNTKKKEGEDNKPYEIIKDYIPYAKKDIGEVIINVKTNSSYFSFGPQEQLHSNLKGLCLASFFCTEYDVDNLLKKGLSVYIYEQMGYGLVRKIISKLDKEIRDASDKHDVHGESEELKKKVDDLDRKIGLYKRLRETVWFIVRELLHAQEWEKLSKDFITELSKDFIIQKIHGDQSDEVKLLNKVNLKNERALFKTSMETYFTEKYSDLETVVQVKVDNPDPLVPYQSSQQTIEENELEVFNNERKALKDIIEKILANPENSGNNASLDFDSWIGRYDEIVKKLEEEKTEAEKILSALAPFDQYNKNRGVYDAFLISLKTEVYRTINKITETFKDFVAEVTDLFLMDDEKMDFDFDKEKGEFKMTIKLENLDDDSNSVPFQPREYLNTFRYKLYCMTLKFAIAFTIKKFYKLNFPIVVDDIFYSSDFSHRNMVRDYFRMLFKKHNELFPNADQQLQVIFFSHDEVVIEAAYRGIRDAGQVVNWQFLYDYREARKDDIVDSGSEQGVTIEYTKLTDSLDV